MVRETCYFASDYEEELREMGTPANLSASTAVVQFPYTEAVSCLRLHRTMWSALITVQVMVEKTEAELSAAAEKRREQGKRLQEMQARQRAEKVGLHHHTCAGVR